MDASDALLFDGHPGRPEGFEPTTSGDRCYHEAKSRIAPGVTLNTHKMIHPAGDFHDQPVPLA
jgi:hypothetical protein